MVAQRLPHPKAVKVPVIRGMAQFGKLFSGPWPFSDHARNSPTEASPAARFRPGSRVGRGSCGHSRRIQRLPAQTRLRKPSRSINTDAVYREWPVGYAHTVRAGVRAR